MQRGATVDTHRLALVAQLARVAGCAGDIQVLNAAFIVLVAGKTHGQVAGVQGRCLLPGLGQKTEAREVVGVGELGLAERQFQGREPGVLQVFHRGALGGVVIELTLLVGPLPQVVDLFHRGIDRQVGSGDVVDDDQQSGQRQQSDDLQGAANEAHGVTSLLRFSVVLLYAHAVA